MKILILIILALAILLFPFRRHFDSPEKIRVLFEKVKHPLTKHFMPIRFIYLAFALFWFFLNKNNIVFSQWDAHRIGIPVGWYITAPVLPLLLYAVFPSTIIWLFPVATLVLGWTLHEQKTIDFLRAHMGVKTDMTGAIVLISLHVLVLALCVIVLYATGPYLRKYLQSNHGFQRIARGSR